MQKASGSKIQIFPDLASINHYAAEVIAYQATEAVSSRGEFHFVLSGGSTPAPLFTILAKSPYDRSIPWNKTHFYWGDERCVPQDDKGSNFGQAHDLLLSKIPLLEENVHRVKGEMAPEEAASDYADQLARLSKGDLRWPRFDVVLLGLGDDGHTASLFPGSGIDTTGEPPVFAVTADYGGRPANRVTLSPGVFNSARLIIFLVVGKSKAEAVAAVHEGEYLPESWPAQKIQPIDGHVQWLIDELAASLLEVYRTE